MGILLGLAAAILYGSSDFGGGLLSRRLGSLAVNVVGSSAAVVLVWIALAATNGNAFGSHSPSVHAIVWGIVSGVGGAVGTLVLYRGLARGQMSVVGPVSAVGAAVLPATVGIAMGERLGVLTVVGVVVALPAIALVAAGSKPASAGSVSGGAAGRVAAGRAAAGRGAVLDGIAAGVAFGVMFIGLAQAGSHSGLWPVAFEQTSSVAFIIAVAIKVHAPLGLRLRSIAAPALVGAGGMAATLLYFFATHSGMLATVAVLTSLYPGVTVLLARVVLSERFSSAQRAGLGLCTLAIVAIAVN